MSGFLGPLALVAAMLAGLALYAQLRQPDAHGVAMARGRDQLRALAPRIPFALVAAECLGRLLPREHVAAWLGADAGLPGIVIGSVVGWLLPGGPMVAFPLAIALSRAGAEQAPLVALITAWALLAINRTLLFEVPLMGTRFTLARIAVSAPLPVLAGVLAAAVAGLVPPA
ncbi:MAG TPA: hypothetical protein VK973_00925 [Arenicellales bacterium]|nr:hypothetical protein [Arenicellales bacterium]